ncbi:MAG: UPF0175 family protein [Planctomycetota bacterium]
MRIEIHLPAQIEAAVRGRLEDLERTAREALLIDLYRRELLTHRELGEALGLDRDETTDLLRRRGVYAGSAGLEDLAGDRATLDRVLGRNGAEPH